MNYPEENIQHSEQGERLKSIIMVLSLSNSQELPKYYKTQILE